MISWYLPKTSKNLSLGSTTELGGLSQEVNRLPHSGLCQKLTMKVSKRVALFRFLYNMVKESYGRNLDILLVTLHELEEENRKCKPWCDSRNLNEEREPIQHSVIIKQSNHVRKILTLLNFGHFDLKLRKDELYWCDLIINFFDCFEFRS